MASTEPDVAEQALRDRVEALHDAVRDTRAALDALTAEFGNWRSEPRLRTLIDDLQSELEAQRQVIETLTAESERQREELVRLKAARSTM